MVPYLKTGSRIGRSATEINRFIDRGPVQSSMLGLSSTKDDDLQYRRSRTLVRGSTKANFRYPFRRS